MSYNCLLLAEGNYYLNGNIKTTMFNLKPGPTGGRNKELKGLVIGTVLLALATLVLRAVGFEHYLYNVSLVFIIIVLLIAIQYGLWPAIAISGLGFLSLDYFFITPYNTFLIDSGPGVVSVVGFLVASIITSQIAARARHQTTQAELRQEETAALNRLNMAVLSVGEAETILNRLVREVAGYLNALAAAIYLPEGEKPAHLAIAAGYSRSEGGLPDPPESFRPEMIQLAFHKKEPIYQAEAMGRQAYLPLLRGGESLGVLTLLLEPAEKAEAAQVFDPATTRWLEILANQVALAVEHARLIQENAQVASLKEADRLKSALLASVSHELRTPLTAIKTALAGLQDEGVEPEEEVEYKLIIDQETDRLNRLISNLLDLSRIEAGALKPDIGWYFLPEIINQTLERLNRSGILAAHPVTTDFGEDLPLAPVDYLQIDQVVTNLVENAAKYSPAGKPITISLRQWPDLLNSAEGEAEPGLLVEICDEGSGVPEADLDRIFDKFYRATGSFANSLRSEVAGSGLGLAICKGIIEAHGGRIWAKPRLYGGSLFAFWLPLDSTKTGELIKHGE